MSVELFTRDPMNRRLGWRPQPHSSLDIPFLAPRALRATRPTSFKNSSQHPHAPYDQREEGSCVGQGIAAQYAFHRMVQGYRKHFMFSRSFIYYMARKAQGWQLSDTGCYPRDAAQAVRKLGAPLETAWDYSGKPAGPDWVYPAGHRSRKEPTQNVLENAALRQVEAFRFVPKTMDDIGTALAMRKPVGFGFMVYASFYDRSTGKPVNVVRPPIGKEKLYGGHYVVAMDYDDNERLALCLNSWGPNNQIKGYFYMTYEMLISEHTSDFLVLDSIERSRV